MILGCGRFLSIRGVLPLLVAVGLQAGVVPNKILSRGAAVHGSGASGLASLSDGSYGWGWGFAKDSWVAYKLDSAPSRVVVAWNTPSYTWSDLLTQQASYHSSCVQGSNVAIPVDYKILTSSNSTNGTDGNWTTRLTVTGNVVSSRSHRLEPQGDRWIKFQVVSGSGNLDEFSVHDATDGGDDTWLFVGTSISAGAFKSSPPAQDFQKLVEAAHPANTPVVVKAGIPCINSADIVRNLSGYLAAGGDNRFWAIELGTNDAWGGGTGNLVSFRAALQTIVDSAKAHGIKPIFARTLATNPAVMGGSAWQVNKSFLDAIDTVAARNKLAPGPDLHAWFLAHPSEIGSDGVHPTAVGGASIQRLWAEAMLNSVYASTQGVGDRTGEGDLKLWRQADGYRIDCGTRGCSRVVLASLDGRVVDLGRTDWVPVDAGRSGVHLLSVVREGGMASRRVFLGR